MQCQDADLVSSQPSTLPHLPQAAYEIREAAERRHQQLTEALASAEARAAAAEEESATAAKAAEGAQRAAARLEKQLGELQAEHAALRKAHEKVGGEGCLAAGAKGPSKERDTSRQCISAGSTSSCLSGGGGRCSPPPSSPWSPPLQLQDDHRTAQRSHEQVVADSAVMLGDLQSWQEKAEALLAELEKERAAHAATQGELAGAQTAAAAAREQLTADGASAAANRAAAMAREEALLAEKAQVRVRGTHVEGTERQTCALALLDVGVQLPSLT